MIMRPRIASALLALVAIVAADQAFAASRPPDAPMIGEAYYKCDRPRLLEGGIYGKGPFHRFGANDVKGDCPRWVRISKEDFKSLAAQWFSHEWKSDLPFWGEP